MPFWSHTAMFLQVYKIDHLPLEEYIVKCSKEIHTPLYLRNPYFAYTFQPLLGEPHFINVLDLSQWPTADKLHLDESQKFALQTAITKEIALIQGPPGTGKTYVGLKMMQLLSLEKHPILVVCYTNHALDQFLEGIAKFHPEGIVRVGGGCKTESLKKYMLHELKERVGYGFRDVKDDIQRSMIPIQKAFKKLQASSDCVLSLTTLKHVIVPKLFEQFTTFGLGKLKSSCDSALLKWLGFSNVENLTFFSYIVKEVMVVWAHPLHKRYPMKHIQQAVVAIGALADYSTVTAWLTYYSMKNEKPNVYPETWEDETNVLDEADYIQDHRKMDTERQFKGTPLAHKNKHLLKQLNQTKMMSNIDMVAAAKLKAMRDEESFEVLRGADVIGMTTTGAAKYRSMIRRLPLNEG
ncbi:NFX1-type zinc finger-containing protein 1-like [Ciona intestinalis]